MNLRTCVDPSGNFSYGIHKPCFKVLNLREKNYVCALGECEDGRLCDNKVNFPAGDVDEPNADIIFEIPNPFPFRGVTYISKRWADAKAENPSLISLPEAPPVSFTKSVAKWVEKQIISDDMLETIYQTLPDPIRLAIAGTSTDPEDLVRLSHIACDFIFEADTRHPIGLKFQTDDKGGCHPVIKDHMLYEILANNRFLPDDYKEVMVLRPGIQGASEIVGEWSTDKTGTHVFEYLRRNSYIPWGHYAANMAHDAVRYRAGDLCENDMTGMRHLYYQRTFVRLAEALEIPVGSHNNGLSAEMLEDVRLKVVSAVAETEKREKLKYNRSLWGWNFGFDYAPSKYRLHASHQQVHQQFALIPKNVTMADSSGGVSSSHEEMPAYACGDLIAGFISEYRQQTGKEFFETYIQAIYNNRRLDSMDKECSLIVYQDRNVLLFVPKAQTSQWELQLMTLKQVGNILEADTGTRASLDTAILIAVKVLEEMGIKMITTIEYSKPFNSNDTDQRLLYSFLPRLPESPGAFSEAQLRWINGHFPEDFAAACRSKLPAAAGGLGV